MFYCEKAKHRDNISITTHTHIRGCVCLSEYIFISILPLMPVLWAPRTSLVLIRTHGKLDVELWTFSFVFEPFRQFALIFVVILASLLLNAKTEDNFVENTLRLRKEWNQTKSISRQLSTNPILDLCRFLFVGQFLAKRDFHRLCSHQHSKIAPAPNSFAVPFHLNGVNALSPLPQHRHTTHYQTYGMHT